MSQPSLRWIVPSFVEMTRPFLGTQRTKVWTSFWWFLLLSGPFLSILCINRLPDIIPQDKGPNLNSVMIANVPAFRVMIESLREERIYLHFSFIEFLHRNDNIIEQETGGVGVPARECDWDVCRVGILRQQSELGPGQKMKMFAMLLHCGLYVKHNFFIEENLNTILHFIRKDFSDSLTWNLMFSDILFSSSVQEVRNRENIISRFESPGIERSLKNKKIDHFTQWYQTRI